MQTPNEIKLPGARGLVQTGLPSRTPQPLSSPFDFLGLARTPYQEPGLEMKAWTPSLHVAPKPRFGL